MKFNSLSVGTLVAGTVALGTLATAPAQAVSVSAGSIGFAGQWEESAGGQAPVNPTLSFSNLNTLFADGIFTGYTASNVQNLPLQRTSFGPENGSIVALYAIDTTNGFDGVGWKTYSNGVDTISFNLDLDATWKRTFDSADNDANYLQDKNSAGLFEYTGTYILPGSLGGGTLLGTGELNASVSGNAQIFEITQQAQVPTPALLPGLIGMGVAAIRKRRGEVEETVEA